ncbi:hypothetical protein [Nonomuraea bangladeshensis]
MAARPGSRQALASATVARELMPCFVGDGTELQACVLDHLRT